MGRRGSRGADINQKNSNICKTLQVEYMLINSLWRTFQWGRPCWVMPGREILIAGTH